MPACVELCGLRVCACAHLEYILSLPAGSLWTYGTMEAFLLGYKIWYPSRGSTAALQGILAM